MQVSFQQLNSYRVARRFEISSAYTYREVPVLFRLVPVATILYVPQMDVW